MKFLVLLAVILLVVWIVRRGGGVSERRPPAPPPKPPALEDMVSCAHCGIHLPRSDALPGRGGLYCGEAHRTLHERELAGR